MRITCEMQKLSTKKEGLQSHWVPTEVFDIFPRTIAQQFFTTCLENITFTWQTLWSKEPHQGIFDFFLFKVPPWSPLGMWSISIWWFSLPWRTYTEKFNSDIKTLKIGHWWTLKLVSFVWWGETHYSSHMPQSYKPRSIHVHGTSM